MNKITTIGLDLAKQVFHLVGYDEHGNEVKKQMLRRSQLLAFFASLPACRIGMEACGSAHHWARQLISLGHDVRLIPAQHVRAYVEGNKNDYNDARAIVAAMQRPGRRFVQVKTLDQQDIQALCRLRDGCVKDRTALCNRIRGLLAEYGVVLPRGIHQLRRRLPALLEDAENGLTDALRALLAREYQRLCELETHYDAYTHKLKAYSQTNEICRLLCTIPGFGPILACYFYSHIGDGTAFRRGRDASASLGVVPRQHTTGGRPVLLGISKRGDRRLRALLVHGARSVVRQAAGKDNRLSRWINRIQARRGHNKAVVALANKMARIGWAVSYYQCVYRPA